MVEILGGYCGELTLQSAIKCNADIALIPEAQMPLAVLAERITRKLSTQNSVVILCSEGYTKEYSPGFQGAIDTMIKQLEPQIGVRIRKTIVGYGLRSGDPTCEEIYQGTIMASEVVRCIQSGMKNKAIIINSSNKPIPIDLVSMKNVWSILKDIIINLPSNSILFEETLHAENFMRMWLRPRFKLCH